MSERRKRQYDKGGQEFVVPHHVRYIVGMLNTQLHRHAYADATASLETLAMAMDLVPEVIREEGVAVVTLDERDANREALMLLKLMLAWQPKHREALTLKMALYLGSHGNLLEAYDTLQSQIQVEPCKSSPYIHGYSGMFKYYMWRDKVTSGGMKGEDEDRERIRVLAGQAVRHFSDMEQLDITPSVTGNVDAFMALHAKLLCWLGSTAEGLQLLTSYRDQYPDRLSSCRMVQDYIRDSGIKIDLVDHLVKIVELDDSGPEVLELAQYYVTEKRFQAASTLLNKFLVYAHNQDNKLASDIIEHIGTKTDNLDNSSDSEEVSSSDCSD